MRVLLECTRNKRVYDVWSALECIGCMRVHLENESALGCMRVH